MKNNWILLMAAATLALSGCGGNGENTGSEFGGMKRNVTTADVDKATKNLTKGKSARLLAASNDFGFRLLNGLVKAEGDGNVFISPPSVSTALAMAYNGASGSTKDAMAKTLAFEGFEIGELNDAEKQMLTVLEGADPKVKLDIANSMWIKTGFDVKREFVGRLEDSFGAKPTVLDFANPESPKTINRWFEQATQGKIKDLVTTLNQDARLLLINAVYFKGLWQKPFDPQATHDLDFTTLAANKKQVPVMSLKADFPYYKGEKFSAVRLPYGSGRLGMVILLPNQGASMQDLLKSVTPKSWIEMSTKMPPIEGTVVIPKFKMDYTAALVEPLKALGMGVAFTDQADFSGMRDQKDLFIGDVQHKTFIEVSEEGTEAAAATKVEILITARLANPKEFTFTADRPFLYAIEDKETGMLIFLGILGDPNPGAQVSGQKSHQ